MEYSLEKDIKTTISYTGNFQPIKKIYDEPKTKNGKPKHDHEPVLYCTVFDEISANRSCRSAVSSPKTAQ